MYTFVILATLSAFPVTNRPNWANRPIITQTVPEYVAPLEPEKLLPMIERIVIWNDGSDFKQGTQHTQLVVGGDTACLKFTAQITAIRGTTLSAKCLDGNGEYLFDMVCKPGQIGVTLQSRVIVAKHDAVCEKSD